MSRAWRAGDRVEILGAWKHTDGSRKSVRGEVRHFAPNADGGRGRVTVKLDDFRRCRHYAPFDIVPEPIIDQLTRLA